MLNVERASFIKPALEGVPTYGGEFFESEMRAKRFRTNKTENRLLHQKLFVFIVLWFHL